MKYSQFRMHQIQRTCKCHYENYKQYKDILSKDFQQRCGYCNMSENTIAPTSFQIDHFIPQKTFKGIRDDLDTEYTNLIWSCPKCNNAKKAQFDGIISVNEADNTLFYKPDIIDYNKIFYRNEYGGIMSCDPKGQNMIQLLKLYRQLYNYGWVYELINHVIPKLSEQRENSTEPLKTRLSDALIKLYRERDKMRDMLIEAYKTNR